MGSVERANCDIKDMLVAWLGDNNTSDWRVGLKFFQFQKNSSLHSGITRSPFAALFGSDARIGLSSSTNPREILEKLQLEDDRLAATESPPSNTNDSIVASGELPVATAADDDSDPLLVSQDPVSLQHDIIVENRKSAREAQEEQAQRMVKRNKRVFGPVSVGDNVTVPIPYVDRGRGDPRNLIGVVTEISDNDMFTIAVNGGVLNGKYSRNQFDVCVTKLYKVDDFNTDQRVSLRQADQMDLVCGGQGFVRCNCSGTKRCESNRCKCFKAKMACNSRCHSNFSCKNKHS
ncbi:hypothetical protein SNE40_014219 [Patella caerulea]|uniref:Uncharacterized protein n=1 Tax=Patella caerulea TaxID=87958 RepID=A0AAN8JGK4_PATCE